MASVNKVILVGNLGRDPETRYAPSGDAICNISVATTDRWRDRASGEMKEQTEWHRISFFGKLAEIAGQYLKKGSQVYIEGSLRTRKWTDKDGIEKYTTEIRADAMQMLGGREGMGGGARMQDGGDFNDTVPRSAGSSRPPARENNAPARPAPQSSNTSNDFGNFDDDIPF